MKIPRSLDVLVEDFAFQDEQECNIKIGSWTHDGHIIDLSLFNNKKKFDLDDFATSSSPYVVTRHEAERVVKKYDCCEEPYPSLEFK